MSAYRRVSCLLAVVFALFLCAAAAEAAITVIGDIHPSYPGGDPWVLSDQDLIVGHADSGRLEITSPSGVLVGNGDTLVGWTSSAPGTISVMDNGALNVDGYLSIGVWASGMLNIYSGGHVVSRDGVIGGHDPEYENLSEYFAPGAGLPTGTGSVTIGDPNSSWTTGSLLVGFSGNGSLSVCDGGRMTDDLAIVGVFPKAGYTDLAIVEDPNSVWQNNRALVVGAWGDGNMIVRYGGQVTAGSAYIGGMTFDVIDEPYDGNYLPTGSGMVTVTGAGSRFDAEEGLLVGTFGEGELDVLAGADVNTGGVVLGGGTDAEGTIVVDGSGSTLNVADELLVGAWGQGEVIIRNEGVVTADTVLLGGFDVNEAEFDPRMLADLGTQANGAGTLYVTGEGSQLNVTGEDTLVVGGWGTGQMQILDGGLVTSIGSTIGGFDPHYESLAEYLNPDEDLGRGTGEVLVSGDGSRWEADYINVGFGGRGTLEVNQDGAVVADSIWAGILPDVAGVLEVTGANSSLTTESELVVGAWGTGQASITNGAHVTAGQVFIGGVSFELLKTPYDRDLMPDGTGTVLVNGTGSRLDVTGFDTLYVGYFGTGTLDVNDGGQVSSWMTVIGGGPDAVGTANVDGSGSQLTSSGLLVGAWGEGQLNITDGGKVEASEVVLGGFDFSEADLDPNMLEDFGQPRGTGTVVVSGTGSELSVSGDSSLYVGYAGTGVIDVNGGAELTSQTAGIAVMPGSSGTVRVYGDGSHWDNSGSAFVGGYGTGQLTVSEKGAVDIGGILFIGGFGTEEFDIDVNDIGYDPNGTGVVRVTGEGSYLRAVGIGVGNAGDGTLEVLDGGEVNGVALVAGIDVGGSGIVRVDGEGSRLTLSSDEVIFDELPDLRGQGDIFISNGGQVDVNGVGGFLGAADQIAVGSEGQGQLDVTNGGRVGSGSLIVGGLFPGYEDLAAYLDPNNPLEGGPGSLLVAGDGSQVQTGTLAVGFSGDGSLEVRDGGWVTDDQGFIGLLPGVEGQAVVSGDGSGWGSNEVLVVGAWGQGNLVVEDGGQVVAPEVYIGGMSFDVIGEDYDPRYIPDGIGSVVVSGEGSRMIVGGGESLYVGYFGEGTLDINDAGHVVADMAVVGGSPDAVGTVAVDGADSELEVFEQLLVGAWGQGQVNITDGGKVTAGTVFIGGFEIQDEDQFDPNMLADFGDPTGTGRVIVKGVGSQMEVVGEDSLVVGSGGTGTLEVLDGGYVTSPVTFVGGYLTFEDDGEGGEVVEYHGGTGTVEVSGVADVEGAEVASKLSSEILVVGTVGDGSLTISQGGYVEDSLGIIGLGADSNGVVTVTGAGSSWRTIGIQPVIGPEQEDGDDEEPYIGTVIVGAWGEGRLDIADGGSVDAVTMYIGGFDRSVLGGEDTDWGLGEPNGTGIVTVSGDGSSLAIGGGDTLYVGYSGNGSLEVLEGGQVVADGVMVGVMDGSSGQVLVDGEGSQLLVEGSDLEWATPVESLDGEGYLDIANGGQVKVEGGWLMVADDISVGVDGHGTLEVADGGLVVAGAVVVGGKDPMYEQLGQYLDPNAELGSGTGTVSVTGSGSDEVAAFGAGDSQASLNADLVAVGFSGTGQMEVTEGGQVNDGLGIIGVMPGGDGHVEVAGSGSLWTNEALVVGAWGEGQLRISDGGRVYTGEAYIGGMAFDVIHQHYDPNYIPDGTGRVLVTGEDSGLYVYGDTTLYVGYFGDGALDVNDGGHVGSQAVVVGAGPEAEGIVHIDGAGSTLAASHRLLVGAWGQGEVDITNGAQVSAGQLIIGGFDPSQSGIDPNMLADLGDPVGSGKVVVSGALSRLSVSMPVTTYIGYSGQGQVEVLHDARMEGTTTYIGYLAGSQGSLRVADANWVGSTIYVGYEGQGQLTVEDGAQVSTSGNTAYIGYAAGSQGSVEVTGGSRWDEHGPIYVGNYGQGSLVISDGGQVYSQKGKIARHEGSEGQVTVTGEGSLWHITDGLYIGGGSSSAGGDGILTVADGGKVYVGGQLVVWPTGRLAGDGEVEAGRLVATGTIAPGGSVGTMTVHGDLVFEPNSVYEVEISNDGSSDKLVVVGDVNIVGGTVKAIQTDTIVGTRQYRIIEANAVSGEFDTLDTALVHSVAGAGLDYDPNAVWLWVTAMAFDDPNICLTWNQQQIGGALQQIADQGGNDITDALQGLGDMNDIGDAYDQLCGQIRPTIAPIIFGVSRLIMGAVSDRFEGASLSGVASTGYNRGMSIEGPLAGPEAGRYYRYSPYRVVAAGNGSPVLGEMPWGIWAKGYGMFGDRERESGLWGYRYEAYGVSIGADYRFSESLTAGLTVGFAESDVDYFGSADESQIDVMNLGLYARYDGGTWYASGLASIGDLTMNTDRYVGLTSEHLTAEFGGNVVNAYLEAGAKWRQLCGWQINPLAAIQLSRTDLDSYTETGGSSALAFDDQQYDSIKGSLGGRMNTDVAQWLGVKGTWELRGRWLHELGDIQSTVEAAFASNRDVVFQVRDAKLPRDSAILGTGLNLQLDRQIRVWLDYDVRLNPDETVHLISCVGQYRW